MSVVRNYDYDMFVSYSHLDDEPGVSGVRWVKLLVSELVREVKQRGLKEFTYWFDEQLAENLPLTDQLTEKITRSATLLIVMSPTYLKSNWCRRERDTFLSIVKDRIGKGSVFIIETREVSHNDYPKEFGDMVSIPFWVLDEESQTDRPLGVPDPREAKFYQRILHLSHHIKDQLDGMVPKVNQDVGPTTVPGGTKSVYVAKSTEDLEDLEEEVRSYLSQFKINVLPKTRYPENDQAAFENAMLADLECCDVYTQLLSATRGRELPFSASMRYPSYQTSIAGKTKKPLLLWRDRNLDITAVKDPGHRELLEAARACGIEEFKKTIVTQIQSLPKTLRPPAHKVMVFVDSQTQDILLAKNIGAELKKHGIDVYYPLEQGDPKALRIDLEGNLNDCDGVLLIYGSSGADWVRHRLRADSKILQQRDNPPKALGVLQGPPPEKVDIGVDISDLVTLDCRNGIDVSIVDDFAARIKSS